MPNSELPLGWILLCVFVYVSLFAGTGVWLERWMMEANGVYKMITFHPHFISCYTHRAPTKAKRAFLIGLKASGWVKAAKQVQLPFHTHESIKTTKQVPLLQFSTRTGIKSLSLKLKTGTRGRALLLISERRLCDLGALWTEDACYSLLVQVEDYRQSSCASGLSYKTWHIKQAQSHSNK